jgi:hypothetical protein
VSAKLLEPLDPVSVVVDGHELQVDAFRTRAATVVKYAIPSGLTPMGQPTLRVNGHSIDAVRATQDGELATIWFGPTSHGDSLTLILGRFLVADPTSGAVDLTLAFDPFTVPALPESFEEPQTRAVSWSDRSNSGTPRVLAVEWWRPSERGDDVRLHVTLDGVLDVKSGGKPTVFGDGAEMRVIGVGVRPATSERGTRTHIWLALEDIIPPRNLTIATGPGGQAHFIQQVELDLAS